MMNTFCYYYLRPFLGLIIIGCLIIDGYAHAYANPYQHHQIQPRIQTLETQPYYNGGISSSSSSFYAQQGGLKLPKSGFQQTLNLGYNNIQPQQQIGFSSDFLSGVSVTLQQSHGQTQHEISTPTVTSTNPSRFSKVTHLSSIASLNIPSQTPASAAAANSITIPSSSKPRILYPPVPTTPTTSSPTTYQHNHNTVIDSSLVYQNARVASSQNPQLNLRSSFGSIQNPQRNGNVQVYQNALTSSPQFTQSVQQQHNQNVHGTSAAIHVSHSYPEIGSPHLTQNTLLQNPQYSQSSVIQFPQEFTQNAAYHQTPQSTSQSIPFQDPLLRQSDTVVETPQLHPQNVANLQDIPNAGGFQYNQNGGRIQYNPNTGKIQYNPNAGAIQYNPSAAINIPFIEQNPGLSSQQFTNNGPIQNTQLNQNGELGNQIQFNQPPSTYSSNNAIQPNPYLNSNQSPYPYPQQQQQQQQQFPPPPPGFGPGPGGPGGQDPQFEPENGFNPNFLQTFPEPPYESEFSDASPLDSKDAIEVEAYRAKLNRAAANRIQPPDFGLSDGNGNPTNNNNNIDYRIVNTSSVRNTEKSSPEELLAIANSKPVPDKCAYNTITKSLQGEDCLEIK